ncbi:hypothetical protein J1614_012096 [Plenodomus biglobosus]|nr:hypothetical protein J1614_012096 [Plenodomus biglobosus]
MMRSEETSRRTSQAPNRDWIDLSFLSHVLPKSKMEGTLGLHPAQISVVVCGTNETRYMVHCYEDTYFNEDRDMSPNEFSSTGVQVDQIAQGDADANRPIWNPHEYFLHVLRNRIQQILREWKKVVRTFESGFRTFSSGRIYFAKNSGSPFAHKNLVMASYWTQSMQQAVCKLLHKLVETTETWTAFIALNGDVGYFSNLDHIPLETKNRIDGMLCHIHEDVVVLQRLQRRLCRIQDECEKLEKFLEVRLLVEGSKNTEMTILYICPVTIVCTFFAIPTPIMSFQRNGQSFFVAIIIVTTIFYILQAFAGGRLRQQSWWATIVARTKLAWHGNRANTVKG